MQPLISVIVPIYKVEDYLKRCVSSIQAQTYSNLEIILVDDGSPDSCGALCDSFAKEDERIVVIHKENGGLSDARNAGLDIAKGEFVAFVDSDDYIAPFFVETLYQALMETQSDTALCSYAVVDEERYDVFSKVTSDTSVYTYGRRELLSNLYDANHEDATYFIVAWNKLYRRELWHDVRFPKGKIHEDEATTYKIYDRCQKGVYIKTPMYGYFNSKSSITRDAFNVKRLEWMEALNDRIAYFQREKENDFVAFGLKARADGAIHYFYPLKKLSDETGRYREEQRQLKGYVKEALLADKEYGNLPVSTKIGYRLFLFSPMLYKRINKQIGEK